MNKPFTDHFAAVATHYADSRPTYPPDLFDWLATQCPEHTLVWDCGTGSGQAAVALAPYFDHVIATDASPAQLDHAQPHPKVQYRHVPAEDSGLDEQSVDLITVAQALHWFDFPKFFTEVLRVLKPGGLFAAWSYGRLDVADAAVNTVIQAFYQTEIGPFWPPERQHVETSYRLIKCPLPPVPTPDFTMQRDWSRAQLLGYIRSWSATNRFLEVKGYDPVVTLEQRLTPLWTDEDQPHRIIWPLTLLTGRKPD